MVHIQGPLATIPLPPTTTAPTTNMPPFWDDDENDDINKQVVTEVAPTEAPNSSGLPSDRPLILYLSRKHTGHKVRVLKVLPALTALKNNEICSITKGNDDGVFTMHERRGINSLKFTRRIHKKGIYRLEITCTPILDEGSAIRESIRLNPFVIHLQLHML